MSSTDDALDASSAAAVVIRQGELRKQGKTVKSWKRRHFVLTNETLSYGKEGVVYGEIQLHQVSGISKRRRQNRNLCFYVQTQSRCYYMQANTLEDLNGWVEAIMRSTVNAIGMNLSTAEATKVCRVFDKFDIDDLSPGRLDYATMRHCLVSLGKIGRDETMDTVVASFDRTGSGDVDLLEFVCGLWMLFKGCKPFAGGSMHQQESERRIKALEEEVAALRHKLTAL